MSSLDPSSPSRSHRRLAAIMSADIAGFSKMVGRDEEGTVALVTDQLARIAAPTVTRHNGQIFKTVGDGFLAVFTSSLDAIRCALDFQDTIRKQNENLPAASQLQYRIGINVGDVIPTGDDYYGDSINIAARIQTAAEAGGICVAGAVYDQVKNRLSCRYASLGAEKFKNIADPIVVYKVVVGTGSKSLIIRKRLMTTAALLALVAAGGSIAFVERAQLQHAAQAAWSILLPDHSGGAATSPAPSSDPGESAAEKRREASFKRMALTMQGDRFNWRTVERLAIEAGITEAEAHEILAAHSKEIVLGKSRDGKLLARLAEH